MDILREKEKLLNKIQNDNLEHIIINNNKNSTNNNLSFISNNSNSKQLNNNFIINNNNKNSINNNLSFVSNYSNSKNQIIILKEKKIVLKIKREFYFINDKIIILINIFI